RLVEHALLGADGQSVADDLVLGLVHEDWTSSTTVRTRMERLDGNGNRTVTHYDFAGRADILQRPGADDYSATKVSGANKLVAWYDAASRVIATEHGYLSNNVPARTEYFHDGVGRTLARQFPNIGN